MLNQILFNVVIVLVSFITFMLETFTKFVHFLLLLKLF